MHKKPEDVKDYNGNWYVDIENNGYNIQDEVFRKYAEVYLNKQGILFKQFYKYRNDFMFLVICWTITAMSSTILTSIAQAIWLHLFKASFPQALQLVLENAEFLLPGFLFIMGYFYSIVKLGELERKVLRATLLEYWENEKQNEVLSADERHLD